jgi:hypothetical protein
VVSDRVIFATARQLMHRLRAARRTPARLIGVSLSSLVESDPERQLTLFDREPLPEAETTRDRTLAKMVDRLRARFGSDAIVPGRLTGSRDGSRRRV